MFHHILLSANPSSRVNFVTFMAEKILGNSRVQPSFRVTLTNEVRRKLRVKVGDLVAYVEDSQGNIILKKAELKVS